MSFGLTNTPSMFQSAKNDLFQPALRRFVLVFFDDILIFSFSNENHYKHLQVVFEKLREHHFHAKPSKCMFDMHEISFLGHKISANGVALNQTKYKPFNNGHNPLLLPPYVLTWD